MAEWWERPTPVEKATDPLRKIAEDAVEIRAHTDPDWVLANLVDAANESGISFAVTLYVGGSVISGVLVGGEQFFDGLGEYIESLAPEGGKSFAAAIRKLGDVYGGSESDDADDSLTGRKRRPPRYIHLKEARLLDVAADDSAEGMWWRGRLSSVDGFTIGTATAGRG